MVKPLEKSLIVHANLTKMNSCLKKVILTKHVFLQQAIGNRQTLFSTLWGQGFPFLLGCTLICLVRVCTAPNPQV